MNFQPPQVITGLPSPCVDASSAGNETRVCIDECAPTGATCDVRIDLRRCTCGGEAVQLQELRRFDMSTGAAVFFAAPSNGTRRASAKTAFFWTQRVVYMCSLAVTYGTGYVRQCGSCVEFCSSWPGETREHHVNTRALSCREAAEEMRRRVEQMGRK